MKCTSLKDLNRVKSSFHLEVYKFREPVEIRIFQGNLFPQGWCNFTAKEMVKKITKSRNVLHISEKHTYNWYSAPHPPKTEPQGISLSTSTTSFLCKCSRSKYSYFLEVFIQMILVTGLGFFLWLVLVLKSFVEV